MGGGTRQLCQQLTLGTDRIAALRPPLQLVEGDIRDFELLDRVFSVPVGLTNP